MMGGWVTPALADILFVDQTFGWWVNSGLTPSNKYRLPPPFSSSYLPILFALSSSLFPPPPSKPFTGFFFEPVAKRVWHAPGIQTQGKC
jgi:hypothetical protein